MRKQEYKTVRVKQEDFEKMKEITSKTNLSYVDQISMMVDIFKINITVEMIEKWQAKMDN